MMLLPVSGIIARGEGAKAKNSPNFYLCQGGYVFARVCLCVNKITQKVMEGSFGNFQRMSEMAKTTSDSILGVIGNLS